MLTIALIGPDGCGKTTLARQLERRLPWPTRYVYMGVSLESSNVMLPTSRLKLWLKRQLGRPADTRGPRDRQRDEPVATHGVRRGLRFVKKGLRLVNQVAEELFRQLLVQWHRLRGRMVILDRDFYSDYYAYDIDPTAQRDIFRRLHGWLLTRVYRKPDIVIFLDVSGETMFARKGEGHIDILNRRREDYRQLQDKVPHFHILDGEQPLHQVRDAVIAVVAEAVRDPENTSSATRFPPAIVVGLNCVTGLQAARSLWRRGVPVVGISSNRDHYCCWTRACQRIVEHPTHGIELIELLESLGPTFDQPAVLLPCTDLSVLTLSEHRERLKPWYRFATPDADKLRQFVDKTEFSELARQVQIPVPRSQILTSLADAKQAAIELRFPCFLKPAIKSTQWESHTKSKVIRVHQPSDLPTLYQRYAEWSPKLLVQEEIVGPITHHFTCDMYFDRNGKLLAHFTSRKLRQWPQKTGTACASVDCRCSAVANFARRIFERERYHGLAYVEMKRDAVRGGLQVVETNVGRPTGRSSAGAVRGIDFPWILYSELRGVDVHLDILRSRSRFGWVHFRRDVQAFLAAWRVGEIHLAPWLSSLGRARSFAVFAFSDPLPSLVEVVQYTTRMLKKGKGNQHDLGRDETKQTKECSGDSLVEV